MSKDNIEPAIFIADFAGKCIREKVMMEKPDLKNCVPQWMSRKEKEYSDHVSSRRTYHYPVSKEQDGQPISEKEFRLQHQYAVFIGLSDVGIEKYEWFDCHEEFYNMTSAKKHIIAIPTSPIEPDQKDEDMRKQIMSIFRDYIHFSPQTESFIVHGATGKLIELFKEWHNKLSEPDAPLQPVKDEIELQKAAKKYAMAGMGIWDVHCIKEYLAFINGAKWQLSSPPEPSSNRRLLADYCYRSIKEVWENYDGQLMDRKSFDDLVEDYIDNPPEPSSKEQEGYWKKRCEAAELLMIDYDPLYPNGQRKRYENWQEIKNQQP